MVQIAVGHHGLLSTQDIDTMISPVPSRASSSMQPAVGGHVLSPRRVIDALHFVFEPGAVVEVYLL